MQNLNYFKHNFNLGLLSISLLIGFILSTNPIYSQQTTQKILLTFSEPMSHESIFDINNYKVLADGEKLVDIIKVGVVEGDTAVVLFVNKNEEWGTLNVSAFNLKDKAGNLIEEENNYANIIIDLQNRPIVNLEDKKPPK